MPDDEPTISQLIELNQRLLDSIAQGDWETYTALCDPTLTAFEPEARGHLVEGMDFHRFYFELERNGGPHNTTIASPHVRVMGDVAVVSYVRLLQRVVEDETTITDAFEETRVPLLIRYPRLFKPQPSDLAVDLTDLMATLLGITGLPAPQQAQGQDLTPYLTGGRDPGEARRFSFSERVGRNRKGRRKVEPGTRGSFMIRGQGWKYVRYPQGDEYLYHLEEDPGEAKNLIGDRRYRSTRDELAAEVDNWLKRTGWRG
jgi:hypothetical protein